MKFRVLRSEYLKKAFDKTKLVYVEVPVQTKHGQHRSHRWKRPNDALDQLKQDLGKKASAENIAFIDKKTNSKINEEQLLEDYSKNAKNEQTIQSFVADNYKVSAKTDDVKPEISEKDAAVAKYMKRYEKACNKSIEKLNDVLKLAKENNAEETIRNIELRKDFLTGALEHLRNKANLQANGQNANVEGAKEAFLGWNRGIDNFIEETEKDISDEVKIREYAKEKEIREKERQDEVERINSDDVSRQLYEIYNNGEPEEIRLDRDFNINDSKYEKFNEDIRENLGKAQNSLKLAKEVFVETSEKSMDSEFQEEKRIKAITGDNISKELDYYLENKVEMSAEGSKYIEDTSKSASECENIINSEDINRFDADKPIILKQENSLCNFNSPIPLAEFYFIKQYSINTKDVNGDIKETKINAFIDRKNKKIVFKEDNNDLISYDRKLADEFNSYKNQLTNRYNKRQKEAKYYHDIEVGITNAIRKNGSTDEIFKMNLVAETRPYLSKALIEMRKANQNSKFPSTSNFDLKATKHDLDELYGSFTVETNNKDQSVSWQFGEKLNKDDFKNLENGKEAVKYVDKLNELAETYGNTKKFILIRNNIIDKALMGLKGSANKDLKVLENNTKTIEYANKSMDNNLTDIGRLYAYSYFNSMAKYPNLTDNFLNGEDTKGNEYKRNPNAIATKSKKMYDKLKGNALKGINNKSIPKETQQKVDKAVKNVKESLKNKDSKKAKELNVNMDMFYKDLKEGRITLSQAINNPKYKDCVYLFLVALQDEEDELETV